MRITHLGILFCIALLFVCASGVITVTATVKIMPLGDSITKGSVMTEEQAKHPTYRYWLWNDLKKGGYDVDFVGSWRMPNFPNVSFDQDNEGHGGYTSDEILHGVPNDRWEPGYLSDWIRGYDYDMVLLLVGTNDVLHGVPTNQSVVNLEKIIKVLRQKNPRVTIFMATLPPATYYRQSLVDLNQEIMGIVERSTTPESQRDPRRPVLRVRRRQGQPAARVRPPRRERREEDREELVRRDQTVPQRGGADPDPDLGPDDRAGHGPDAGTDHGRDRDDHSNSHPGRDLDCTGQPLRGQATTPSGACRARRAAALPPDRGRASPPADSGRFSPGSAANDVKPPSKMFQRWYPAQRWAVGLR